MRSIVLYRALWLACGLVLFCFWGCDFPTTGNVISGVQDFQTMQVRYVNLTNSPVGHVLQARFTVYTASTRTTSVATITTATVESLQISQFFVPLADSSRITVTEASASNAFYSLALPLTFTARNATYTIIGLPPRPAKDKVSILDTLLVVTSLPPDASANTASVRFINCIDDTTKTYSFALGCPSGTPVGSNLAYRASSGVLPIALNGDNLSVAITEQTRPVSSTASASASVLKGLFNLRPLTVGNSYTVLLYKVDKDSVALLALNDRASSPLNVTRPAQPSTFLRVANFSGNSLESVLYGSSQKGIAVNLGNTMVSGYDALTACTSAGKDTIIVNRRNGIPSQKLATSLDVNGSQTVFVGDSSIVAASALSVQPSGGTLFLRVVNLSTESISVFRGALGQQRTQTMVGNLPKGSISAVITLARESVLPLMVFNTKQPQSLEHHALARANMYSASAYFLVIAQKQMYLVPDVSASSIPKPVATAIDTIPYGTLVQALHLFSDATTGTAQIDLHSVFSDNVAFGSPQLTVLPTDSPSITLGSKTQSITMESANRLVVIGIGTTTASQVLVEKGLWTWPSDSLPRQGVQGWLRYLNASRDVSALRVQADTQIEFYENAPLAQGQSSSPIRRFYRDQTRTLTFLNNSGETLYVARNLTFSLGKGYTIIFSGQSSNGYNIIVLPEY